MRLSRVLSRSGGLFAVLLTATPIFAFHDGDLIYGGVSGQVRVVQPTNLLPGPYRIAMDFVPSSSPDPAFWLRDQGFDWWNLSELTYGILHVQSATLVSPLQSSGYTISDGAFTYFHPGAQRQSFLFQGSSRHKHFQMYTLDPRLGKEYKFDFQIVNATSVTGGQSLSNSPVYSLVYYTDPGINLAPTTMTIPRDLQMSGSVAQLGVKDDQSVFIRSGYGNRLATPSLYIESTVPTGNIQVLQLSIQSKANVRSLLQKSWLYNFSTGTYDLVTTSNIGGQFVLADKATAVNINQYIEPITRRVVAFVRWYPSNPSVTIQVDQASWQYYIPPL